MNALTLWHESLSKQVLNPSPIDMYFYSDTWRARYYDASTAESLISLSQYTHPSRIIFGDGSFKREGMRDVLQWMVQNANRGYFQNLEYFQMSDHFIAIWDSSSSIDPNYGELLGANIVTLLGNICADKVNFPKMREFNFNNNGYNLFNNGFDALLRGACNSTETGVTVYARDVSVNYPMICNPSASENHKTYYYDMNNQTEIDQCQFTWNWEIGGIKNNGYKPGPFPNDQTPEC